MGNEDLTDMSESFAFSSWITTWCVQVCVSAGQSNRPAERSLKLVAKAACYGV